jgi:ribosomal protein S17E
MSIDDATPEEWDEVHQKLKNLGISHEGLIRNKYGNDVDSPFHYNKGSIECIDAIQSASTKEEFEGYLRNNVIKYVWRFRYKDNIKDLNKAKWYLEKLIEEVENV